MWSRSRAELRCGACGEGLSGGTVKQAHCFEQVAWWLHILLFPAHLSRHWPLTASLWRCSCGVESESFDALGDHLLASGHAPDAAARLDARDRALAQALRRLQGGGAVEDGSEPEKPSETRPSQAKLPPTPQSQAQPLPPKTASRKRAVSEFLSSTAQEAKALSQDDDIVEDAPPSLVAGRREPEVRAGPEGLPEEVASDSEQEEADWERPAALTHQLERLASAAASKSLGPVWKRPRPMTSQPPSPSASMLEEGSPAEELGPGEEARTSDWDATTLASEASLLGDRKGDCQRCGRRVLVYTNLGILATFKMRYHCLISSHGFLLDRGRIVCGLCPPGRFVETAFKSQEAQGMLRHQREAHGSTNNSLYHAAFRLDEAATEELEREMEACFGIRELKRILFRDRSRRKLRELMASRPPSPIPEEDRLRVCAKPECGRTCKARTKEGKVHKSSLKDHICSLAHGFGADDGVVRFACRVCGDEGFSYSKELHRHFRQRHPNSGAFTTDAAVLLTEAGQRDMRAEMERCFGLSSLLELAEDVKRDHKRRRQTAALEYSRVEDPSAPLWPVGEREVRCRRCLRAVTCRTMGKRGKMSALKPHNLVNHARNCHSKDARADQVDLWTLVLSCFEELEAKAVRDPSYCQVTRRRLEKIFP